MTMLLKLRREDYIPKHALKVQDKKSDAVAYVYSDHRGRPCARIFVGKQAKPLSSYYYGSEAMRDRAIVRAFTDYQAAVARKAGYKAERKAKTAAFLAEIEVGDIFHYSFGYDETHHVYYEVTGIKGKFATVRKIGQAQKDLGYDWRHECVPQSGDFIGPEQRVLIQDGRIAVDRHYHARKWNTSTVAGVKLGPVYSGGGGH